MSKINKTKIIHIINGLSAGGAEIMLKNVLTHMDKSKYGSEVISLTTKGILGQEIEEMGINVKSFCMQNNRINMFSIMRLVKYLHQSKPDIIQTWMYHSNLIGGVAGKLSGVKKIIWGIHASRLNNELIKNRTKLIIKANTWAANYIPDNIIFCSKSSYNLHKSMGYKPYKMQVIPNGFDLNKFSKNSDSKYKLRKELGLEKNSVLIGMAARYDPMKGYQDFIEAAKILHASMPDVHFLLCGTNVTDKNKFIESMISHAQLTNNIHLLGYIENMQDILPALDVATIASVYGEAFPMIMGEAMACEIPMVVTDVGDTAYILGNTDFVVPVHDPVSIANAWMELLDMNQDKRENIGKLSRDRIKSFFSIESIVKQYENVYKI